VIDFIPATSAVYFLTLQYLIYYSQCILAKSIKEVHVTLTLQASIL